MERYDYDNRRKGSPVSHKKRPSKVGFSIFFLLVTNIPMAPFCMSLVHQVHEMHPPLHWTKSWSKPCPTQQKSLKWLIALMSFLHFPFLFLSTQILLRNKMGKTLNYPSRKKNMQRVESSEGKKIQVGMVIFSSFYFCVDLTLKYAGQRGAEDVMIYLSREAQTEEVKSILFLMPCHATPYYSTLHHDLPKHILDCSPRFGFQQFGWSIIWFGEQTVEKFSDFSFFQRGTCGACFYKKCFSMFVYILQEIW